MQYASLDEVYPVKKSERSERSEKKSGKKSGKKSERSVRTENNEDIQAFNAIENSNSLAFPASEYESTVPLYKTVNHCTPLEAPPYKFPVSDEALDKFNEALDVMDNIEDTQNLDEFDTYLENTHKDSEKQEKAIIKRIPRKIRKNKNNNNDNQQHYEILLFISLGLILIFMCEVIARIAMSRR